MAIQLKRFSVVYFLLFNVYHSVYGYPQYQEVVPNGDRLPHPCKPNYIWHGIGHLHDRGGGDLNNFGKDFMRLGKKWSKSLCQLDSDNDGLSNGEELGDPNCVWAPGKSVQKKIGLTHPGVCDPWNSPKCKQQNAWVDCEIDELKCNSTNEEGVKNITLRMPRTKVPGVETSYMCTMFDVPSDGDYHIIANKPFIDNEYVMHHMLFFGCKDTESVRKYTPNVAERCSMQQKDCNAIIGLWTVGSPGECSPKQFGYRIGTKGYKRVVLQAHWNNPELKTDYVDSSGLTLYYTSKLRPNDAAVMLIGSVGFELPPGRPEVTVVGSCAAQCTKEDFSGPIYVTSALNHMHYLGRKQKVELIRNGVKIQDLTNEDTYNYDSPKSTKFAVPIEVLPGDELRSTCVYKTTSKENFTYFGMGTNDEMCFGGITFYPQQNVKNQFCSTWKSIPVCELRKPNIRGCNIKQFANISHPEFVDMREAVMDHCSTNSTCFKQCEHHLKIIKSHPCMNGDVGEFFRSRIDRMMDDRVTQFYQGMDSCSSQFKLLSDQNHAMVTNHNFVLLVVMILPLLVNFY